MTQPVAEPPSETMTREEYYAWAAAQPRGRYERVGGHVVAMAPERLEHTRVKGNVYVELRRAVRAAGVPCQALPDGASIRVGEDTDYEPDAMVTCGERQPGSDLVAKEPVVVVEVLSPSTRGTDTGAKLTDYFLVPSVQHYLIVRADRPAVVHHRRDGEGGVATRIVASGPLALDPPGLTVEVEAFYVDD